MGLRIEKHLTIGRLHEVAAEALPPAVTQATEHVRAVAVARTPVETGRLAGSAAVHIEIDGDEVAGAITYDGPYARYQHERLDLRHENGQAKYLESALFSEADTALQIVADHVKRSL